MRSRTRSPSPYASGQATVCRPTRAPGSRRPPATAPPTACAASRVDEKAAINAVHADATTLEQTDWSQIVALYDQLLALAPTPVVALNRAIAIGEVQGASAALALVDELDLDNYHPFHATRADLLANPKARKLDAERITRPNARRFG